MLITKLTYPALTAQLFSHISVAARHTNNGSDQSKARCKELGSRDGDNQLFTGVAL